ncbi:MAG: hypothetical protein AB7U05_10650 [Mangrovibacterium sp.]
MGTGPLPAEEFVRCPANFVWLCRTDFLAFADFVWRPSECFRLLGGIVWRVAEFVWRLSTIVWLPGVILRLLGGLFQATGNPVLLLQRQSPELLLVLAKR